MSDGPLSGYRVLDASRVLAGPFCAMMLGDLGADVIKVEQPGAGDQTRAWGPPFMEGESTYYLSCNRNKRSIALDLKNDAGRKVFLDLLDRADILIDNFRPATFDRLGIGNPCDARPQLIWCSITGHGRTGSWADRPAYDVAMLARSGIMAITGTRDGEPVRVGVAVTDMLTAHYATQGILAAALHRERTGKGQQVDISMLESSLAFQSYAWQEYFVTGQTPPRLGTDHQNLTPYGAYPTSDGWVILGAASEAIWHRLCDGVGRPELKDQPKFKSNRNRVIHRDEVREIFNAIFRKQSTAEWIEQLNACDVPIAALNDYDAVMELPPINDRGAFAEFPHPTIGTLKQPVSPVRLSKSPPSIRRHPPRLGEHTEEILSELGFDAPQQAELGLSGALGPR